MRPVFFFPHATILDCGASRTTLAVFSRKRNGRLRLEQFSTVALAIETGQEGSWLQKTGEALVTLRSRVQPVGPVAVVLPPHLTLMKMLGTPRVEKSKREKIISFESQQSIPYPLTDVVWDRMISGENAHGFKVLLCAAKLEVLDPFCATLASAGLAPGVLLPSVLALAAGYRELRPEPAPACPTLLVNLGARSTTLVLIDQDGFQARSLSLGGGAVPAPDAGACVDSFANRLAQEITRTLLYFERPLKADRPVRLRFTGGAARLPGLTGLVAKQLETAVEVLDPAGGIEIGRAAGAIAADENRSTFLDCLGGAACVLKAAPCGFNLLPPRLRAQAGRRRLRPRLAVAAGLAVALLVPVVVNQRKIYADAHARNLALERELAPLRLVATRSQEHRQKLTDAQRREEAQLKIAEARRGWLFFLGSIESRFSGAGEVWLERMQWVPVIGQEDPARPASGTPLRIAFAGLMRLAAGEARARETDYQRIRGLLETVATVPAVAAVEGERFEPVPSGYLRFEFVVVLKEPLAL